MRRRQRADLRAGLVPLVALVAMMVLLVGTVSTVLALGIHRPHMGAPSSDQGTVYWNPLRHNWGVYRWTGCRTIVRWYIEPNVPSGWHAAITSGVSSVGQPQLLRSGLHQDDRPERGAFEVPSRGRRVLRHEWKAWCGTQSRVGRSAASSSNQAWTVAFNDKDANFAVGTTGRFDIESIVVNEMGHVLYLDHNTGWFDGTVQANSCAWGTTTCRVTNELSGFSDFSAYTASCSNCGSRRSVLTGDWLAVTHIYGKPGNPCTGICPNGAGAREQVDPGPLSQEAIAAERWKRRTPVPQRSSGMTSISSVNRRLAAVLVAIVAVGCSSDGVTPTTTPSRAVSTADPTGSADPCSSEEVAFAAVMSASPEERLECFGGKTIIFRAYASSIIGVGSCTEQVAPGDGWLNPCGGQARVLIAQPGDGEGLAAYFPPTLQESDVPIEAWVDVSGHFDDPAAQTCGVEGAVASEAPSDEIVEVCRQLFVIDQIFAASS